MSAPASTQAHGALDRGVQALDRERIGARHDDEAGIGARIDRGLDAIDHLLACETTSLPGRWPQRLAPTWSSMCTAPAPALISDLTVRAMLKALAPKPVSTSTSSGRSHDVGDAADVGQHVVERADAEVGHAERAGGDAAAGEVERLDSRRASASSAA